MFPRRQGVASPIRLDDRKHAVHPAIRAAPVPWRRPRTSVRRGAAQARRNSSGTGRRTPGACVASTLATRARPAGDPGGGRRQRRTHPLCGGERTARAGQRLGSGHASAHGPARRFRGRSARRQASDTTSGRSSNTPANTRSCGPMRASRETYCAYPNAVPTGISIMSPGRGRRERTAVIGHTTAEKMRAKNSISTCSRARASGRGSEFKSGMISIAFVARC
jgi:hypothetical protein